MIFNHRFMFSHEINKLKSDKFGLYNKIEVLCREQEKLRTQSASVHQLSTHAYEYSVVY